MCETSHHRVSAITGTIGSGKTSAAGFFEKSGAKVISADELAREVVLPDSVGLQAIIRRFGSEILSPGPGGGNSLNRKALGALVFSDPLALADLEQITHPLIQKLANERFRKALAAKAPLVLYDCPLLFEKKLDALGFRHIILIAATPENCLKRIQDRDGIPREEAEARLALQLSIAEKRARADIIIENDGTLEELEQAVRNTYRRLIEEQA
jgi:dephospho-CoA kinase